MALPEDGGSSDRFGESGTSQDSMEAMGITYGDIIPRVNR